MATIDDLHKSLSELSTDELMEKLMLLRQSRRTKKRRSKTTRTTTPQKKLLKDIVKLTPEAIQKLISELEGGVK